MLLHTLPMFHANGWGMPYAATAMAARHVVLRKVDGEEILARVEREGVTLLCGAPAVVAMILDAAAARARRRGARCPGAARCASSSPARRRRGATIERVESELGWEFVQIYGLTETSPLLTINRAPSEWDDARRRRSAPRCSAARASPPSASRSPSTSTARSSRGPTTSSRATGTSPTRPRQALEGGWFHTGDGGYLDGPYTVITDRRKDVIITGGENVSSIEVEDCLFQHPAVAEVAVIGVPDETWGESVKALVVLRDGPRGHRGRADRALPRVARALQGAEVAWSSATSSRGPPRQAPEVQAPRAVLGGPGPRGELTGPAWERRGPGRDRDVREPIRAPERLYH